MYRQTIEVPKFIEKIELSKHRRAKYYKVTEELPKKYSNKELFEFGIDGYLYDTKTGTKVIKNTRTVGTPNVKVITGQYYWQGAHPHVRRKMKREMSIFFCDYLNKFKRIKEEDYPVGIRIDLYDEMEHGTQQDLDNFIFLYRKVIHDVLVDHDKSCKRILIDDSKKYIQEIPTTFYPISDHKDRKLVIEIYSLKK